MDHERAQRGDQPKDRIKTNTSIDRNLGEQPIVQIMREHHLKPHDLVIAAPEPITHKMVARACKGRRLTAHTQAKMLQVVNQATGMHYSLRDLFNY